MLFASWLPSVSRRDRETSPCIRPGTRRSPKTVRSVLLRVVAFLFYTSGTSGIRSSRAAIRRRRRCTSGHRCRWRPHERELLRTSCTMGKTNARRARPGRSRSARRMGNHEQSAHGAARDRSRRGPGRLRDRPWVRALGECRFRRVGRSRSFGEARVRSHSRASNGCG